MLSPKEAVDLLDLLTECNDGRPVFVIPVRVVRNQDGTTSKLPKGKWAEAESVPSKVSQLWERKSGGYAGVHLERSGLTLADQDFDVIPDDLTAILDASPTFTSLSLSRGLPHRWYRSAGPARDRRWMWRGTHVGDIKSKGIGVLGTVTDPRAFEPVPEQLDAVSLGPPVAEGSLKLLVTAWLGFLDRPPTQDEALDWARYSLTVLSQARPGERNNALYRAARDVAQVCAAGALAPQDGASAVVEAAAQVFTDEELRHEVRATIESAFDRERRAAS